MSEFRCQACLDTGIGNWKEISRATGGDVSLERAFREGVPCDCPAALSFADLHAIWENQNEIPQVRRAG